MTTRGIGLPITPVSARRVRMNSPAGTPARTFRSCRCDPNGWSKSVTITWKVKDSATQRNSTVGGPTASHGHAPILNWNHRSPFVLPTSFLGSVRPTHADDGRVTDQCADCGFVYDVSQSAAVARKIRERVAEVV